MWLGNLGPKKEPEKARGVSQSGYLWGQGAKVTQVGESDGWHWRIVPGITLPKWELYYGGRPVGMEVFTTNEVKDWPDMLFQMLLGLKGLEENPLSDEETDEIIAHATEAAETIRGFPWRWKKKNPYPRGTHAAELWAYTFRCAYAESHGVELD